MQSNLTLDEKTTRSVSDINLKYAKETQTLMDSSGPQLGKLMTFRKNAQAKDAELKGVLTPAACDPASARAREELQGNFQMEANECHNAKQQLVNAATADQVDLARRKMEILCSD